RGQALSLEADLLARLQALALHPAARHLEDDAAVLAFPLGAALVATHDMLAESVHFTPDCPPVDIGWKLAAVNLSDLAAMGARPVGMLLGFGIGTGRDASWAEEVARGVAHAADRFSAPVLGGDTVRLPDGSVLALTALGQIAEGTALGRAGARAGDDLWVSGTIGDAGLGLEIALGKRATDPFLLRRYRRPTPRLALGHVLRGVASACMDVSDGLLLDAGRMAAASGVGLAIESSAIPTSGPARASGVSQAALARMGDDYELLFAAPMAHREQVEASAAAVHTPVARIGQVVEGAGVWLDSRVAEGTLGFAHR
ncbi:MAG: thiamine-phosphate kinase, partial [Thermaurantiacus sp.]